MQQAEQQAALNPGCRLPQAGGFAAHGLTRLIPGPLAKRGLWADKGGTSLVSYASVPDHALGLLKPTAAGCMCVPHQWPSNPLHCNSERGPTAYTSPPVATILLTCVYNGAPGSRSSWPWYSSMQQQLLHSFWLFLHLRLEAGLLLGPGCCCLSCTAAYHLICRAAGCHLLQYRTPL